MTATLPSTPALDFNVVLLHDEMVDKHQKLVTTSITMIDVHDIARSARTFGVHTVYIAHPAPAMQKLVRTLRQHWDDGFGAVYNPNRLEALAHVEIVSSIDEAIDHIDRRAGKLPNLIATSAKTGGDRISCAEYRRILPTVTAPQLLMFGTGWGMSDQLLMRADTFLEPILGPGEYTHLSVRSACAIMLDRLFGLQVQEAE